MNTIVAARLFAVLTTVVCAFQMALAAGAPWGEYAMGGRYPGRFPPELRFAAVVQLLVLAAFAGVVLTRAGLVLNRWQVGARRIVWVVVAFCAVSTLANLATPSFWERVLWAPVAVGMLATSVVVARGE